MEDIFYLKEHKVLFGKDEYGEYVPTHYNVAVDDRGTPIEGTEIVDGDILFDWLVYVKETMKTRSAKTGKWRNGNLYMYQWGVSINIVLDIMSFKADIWDIAWSRQSGKSRMMQELPAFITVFGQKYADLKNENGWTTIVASYTDKAVKKWYAPIRDKIYKAIELFNRMYPNSPLVYGKNKYKNVADTEEHMVIDIVFENKSYTYSEIWALSTGTDQDGFSAATLFLDEATLTKAFGEDGFFKSLKPFTNSVSGTTICTGITCTDNNSVAYVVHFSEDSKHCIYNWKDIYEFKKIVDIDAAEDHKRSVMKDINLLGENSTEVAVNYMMTYEIIANRLITQDAMRRNNLMQGELGSPNKDSKFIAAGLDLSSVSDRTVLTIGEFDYDHKGRWKFTLKEIIVFNMDRSRLNTSKVISDIKKYCKTFEIDMLLCDGTSMQQVYVEMIIKELKENEINTLVADYNFAGSKNKIILMSNLENMLFSQRCILPRYEITKTSKEWELLYKELITMIKDKSKGINSNTQYYGQDTDDCVISLSLACYCVPYLERLENSRKFIEVGTYKYRAKLSKFKIKNIKEKIEMPSTYMTIL